MTQQENIKSNRLVKNELDGKMMIDFVALRPKGYSSLVDDGD